jgi:hypothetical protein
MKNAISEVYEPNGMTKLMVDLVMTLAMKPTIDSIVKHGIATNAMHRALLSFPVIQAPPSAV